MSKESLVKPEYNIAYMERNCVLMLLRERISQSKSDFLFLRNFNFKRNKITIVVTNNFI